MKKKQKEMYSRQGRSGLEPWEPWDPENSYQVFIDYSHFAISAYTLKSAK